MKIHAAALALGIALGASASWQIAQELHRPTDFPASYTSQDRRDLSSLVRAVRVEAKKDPQFRKPR